MKKNYFLFFGIYLIPVISFFISSCWPGTYIPPDPYIVNEGRQKKNFYYVPSAPNTPLLTEKNDLNFSVMRASGSGFTGAEIQASALPWKHLGLNLSYSNGGTKGFQFNDYNNKSDFIHYNRFEIGSGYVTKFAGGFHFETYGGFGTGNIRNSHHTGSSKINIKHIFVQPAIAISNEKQTIQFAFSSRFARADFKVIDTLFNTDRERFSSNQIKTLYDQPFHMLWEPTWSLRAGWKNLLFNFQYNSSIDLTNRDLYRAKNNISLGFSLRLNATDKKTTKRVPKEGLSQD